MIGMSSARLPFIMIANLAVVTTVSFLSGDFLPLQICFTCVRMFHKIGGILTLLCFCFLICASQRLCTICQGSPTRHASIHAENLNGPTVTQVFSSLQCVHFSEYTSLMHIGMHIKFLSTPQSPHNLHQLSLLQLTHGKQMSAFQQQTNCGSLPSANPNKIYRLNMLILNP